MADLTKLYDRTDTEKWAHPELAPAYNLIVNGTSWVESVYNMNESQEWRNQAAAAHREQSRGMVASMADQPAVTRQEHYSAPGCPEEPDAPEVDVIVYRPEKPAEGKLPLLFVCSGGGMLFPFIEGDGWHLYADDLNCIVVAPRYRDAFEAPFPAALNDLHAGWEYAMSHADELGFDPDLVTICGDSSGSHMAVSLAFRVKRYGYHPRGCVTDGSLMDIRPIYPSSTIKVGWGDALQSFAGRQYLGADNVPCYNTPEMFPAFATPEDCIGLCPIFMHADTENGQQDACAAFLSILGQAGVYRELHEWGGSNHTSGRLTGQGTMDVWADTVDTSAFSDDTSSASGDGMPGYGERYKSVFYGNIADCWKYDLRRTFIEELVAE